MKIVLTGREVGLCWRYGQEKTSSPPLRNNAFFRRAIFIQKRRFEYTWRLLSQVSIAYKSPERNRMLCFHFGSVGWNNVVIYRTDKKMHAEIKFAWVNYSSTRARGCVVARSRPRTNTLITQTKCHIILSASLIPSQTNISRTNKMVFSVACLQISELIGLKTPEVLLTRIFAKIWSRVHDRKSHWHLFQCLMFLTIESREMKLPKKDVICYYFRFELMNIPHTFTVN